MNQLSEGHMHWNNSGTVKPWILILHGYHFDRDPRSVYIFCGLRSSKKAKELLINDKILESYKAEDPSFDQVIGSSCIGFIRAVKSGEPDFKNLSCRIYSPQSDWLKMYRFNSLGTKWSGILTFRNNILRLTPKVKRSFSLSTLKPGRSIFSTLVDAMDWSDNWTANRTSICTTRYSFG